MSHKTDLWAGYLLILTPKLRPASCHRRSPGHSECDLETGNWLVQGRGSPIGVLTSAMDLAGLKSGQQMEWRPEMYRGKML